MSQEITPSAITAITNCTNTIRNSRSGTPSLVSLLRHVVDTHSDILFEPDLRNQTAQLLNACAGHSHMAGRLVDEVLQIQPKTEEQAIVKQMVTRNALPYALDLFTTMKIEDEGNWLNERWLSLGKISREMDKEDIRATLQPANIADWCQTIGQKYESTPSTNLITAIMEAAQNPAIPIADEDFYDDDGTIYTREMPLGKFIGFMVEHSDAFDKSTIPAAMLGLSEMTAPNNRNAEIQLLIMEKMEAMGRNLSPDASASIQSKTEDAIAGYEDLKDLALTNQNIKEHQSGNALEA